jgi:hypothetical protein
MMSTKVANTISAFVHDENLETLKKLKVFLEEKMDDADEVTDMIDEFTSTLSLTKVKSSKKKLAGDKPKRTRKPTFYNHWLGERLRTFSAEQKNLPEDDRVGKTGRMKVIAEEWKEFKKNSNEFDEAKAKWEELSSSDEILETPKEVKKEKKEKANKPKKSKVVPEKVEEDDDSDDDSDDEDNSPVAINSDSEDDDI